MATASGTRLHLEHREVPGKSVDKTLGAAVAELLGVRFLHHGLTQKLLLQYYGTHTSNEQGSGPDQIEIEPSLAQDSQA